MHGVRQCPAREDAAPAQLPGWWWPRASELLFVLAVALGAIGCGDEGSGATDAEQDASDALPGDVSSNDGETSGEDSVIEPGDADAADGDDTPPPVDTDMDAEDTGFDIQDPCNDLVCDDGKPCTVDTCHPVKGCQFTAKDCGDGDACTIDTCDPATGNCTSSPATCDDGNACTDDSCVPQAGCQYKLVSCNDDNPCTVDSCAPATGTCINKPNSCNDGDPCTTDSCDASLGCAHEPKEGPCCLTAVDCADGLPCTQDVCLDGQCTNLAIPNCCTTATDCNTGNPCLESQCQSGKCFSKPSASAGCCTTPSQCNDGNPCTEDGCAASQCVHTPTCCDEPTQCGTSACANAACAEGVGCVFTVAASDCCDPEPFLLDFDGPTSGIQIANGVQTVGWHLAYTPDAPSGSVSLRYGTPNAPNYVGPGGPHKGSATTPWFELPAGAPLTLKAQVKLDVRALATQDIAQIRLQSPTGQVVVWKKPANASSNEWQPISAPISAYAGQAVRLIFYFDAVTTPPATGTGFWIDSVAVESSCAPQACETAGDCSDGADYSTDVCVAETEACHWLVSPTWCDEVKSCDDGDPCTQNLCVSNACIYQPITNCCIAGDACDDGNPCTADTCNVPGSQSSGVCQHSPVLGCCTQLSQCNDLNPCTIDTCDFGALQCINDVIAGCCSANVQCDDGDPCTLDTCASSTCSHVDLCCASDDDCDDGDDLCTEDTCQEGKCSYAPTNAPGCCSPDTASYSFDGSDVGQWTFNNSAGPAMGWQVWPAALFFISPPAVLYYGDPINQNFAFNGLASNGTATSPAFTILPNTGVELRLWARMDTESGSSYDKLTVRARTGSSVFDVWTKATTTPGQWFEIVADLSAFSGKTIQLELFFDTVDTIANNTLGVLIDDIRVLSTCTPNTCTAEADCDDAIAATQQSCTEGTCTYTVP